MCRDIRTAGAFFLNQPTVDEAVRSRGLFLASLHQQQQQGHRTPTPPHHLTPTPPHPHTPAPLHPHTTTTEDDEKKSLTSGSTTPEHETVHFQESGSSGLEEELQAMAEDKRERAKRAAERAAFSPVGHGILDLSYTCIHHYCDICHTFVWDICHTFVWDICHAHKYGQDFSTFLLSVKTLSISHSLQLLKNELNV